MAFQDKKFLDAEGITHLVRLLDEYPNNQVLGTVIDAIEGELENKAEKSEIPEVPVQDVQINGTSILRDGVANVPIAGNGVVGGVQIGAYGTHGLSINGSTGLLVIAPANQGNIKAGNVDYKPIIPKYQHESTFYGLAKAAGDTTQSSSANEVGNYTNEAKEAIQAMLGIIQMLAPTNPSLVASQAYSIGDVFAANSHLYKATAAIAQDEAIIPDTNCVETTMAEASGKVKDVQINGVSVMQDGVANIPVADAYNLGLIKVHSNGVRGLAMTSDGYLANTNASTAQIKTGTDAYRPITPNHINDATFYGLSKAAGVDLANETVTLGTYPEASKAAIKAMLGVQDGSTGTVDVTGTTPTITAVENTRYVCGEVTSLNFTPPASGISIVRFTSGSSVTVLTIPSTVKFPEWFDPTSLETNTIYEICVTDGEFGAVMSWAL